MTGVPEWMRPPRPEGWYSEDLDKITEAPRHTELIDGHELRTTTPFAIKIDLDGLVPGQPVREAESGPSREAHLQPDGPRS